MRPRTFLSLPLTPWSISLGVHFAFFLVLLFPGWNRVADLTVINLDLAPAATSPPLELPRPLDEDEWRKPETPKRFLPPPPKKLEIKTPPLVVPAASAPSTAEGGTGTSGYRSVAQVSKLPQYDIQIPESEYPEAARKANVEGTVILQVYWDATGKVQKVEVVQGLGYGFEELAVKYVMKTVFTPAYAGADPVPYKGPISFRFKLKTPGY